MIVIMLSGAGANGKTRCVQELEKLFTKYGRTSISFFSTTRKTFKRLGLDTEKTGLELSLADQEKVQNEVFSDYLADLLETAKEGAKRSVDILLCDRSPFDYSAYVCVTQQHRTEDQLQERVDASIKALNSLKGIASNVFLITLPRIPPWRVEDDGYRAQAAGRSYAWDATVRQIKQDVLDSDKLEPGIEDYTRALNLNIADTSEERALQIASFIGVSDWW